MNLESQDSKNAQNGHDQNAYYSQLRQLRSMVHAAEESLRQGKAKPLDCDALISRVRDRIAIATGSVLYLTPPPSSN